MGMYVRLVAISIALVWSASAYAQRGVYLVRHAQKENQGDTLTDLGNTQAELLARLLADAGISEVFTTQFERTKQTAGKLVTLLKSQGVDVRTSSIPLPDELLSHLDDKTALEKYAKTVARKIHDEVHNESGPVVGHFLVVGHDLTIPAIIDALGCKSEVKIDIDEFTHLFIVVPAEGAAASSLFHVRDYMVLQPPAVSESSSAR